MDIKRSFQILGIEETMEKPLVKMAYRRKLAEVNPEEHQEGFKRLREAYEQILLYIEKNEKAGEEETPLILFLKRLDDLYHSLSRRLDGKQWQQLLKDEVLESMEYSEEAKREMFRYLAQHFRIPAGIWRLLCDYFYIPENEQEFKEFLPVDFVDFMIRKAEDGEENDFPFHRFVGKDEADYDGFISEFNTLADRMAEEPPEEEREAWLQGIKEKIEYMDSFAIGHPWFELEKAKYALLLGEKEEALRRLTAVWDKREGDGRLLFAGAAILRACDRHEEAEEIFLSFAQQEKIDRNVHGSLLELAKICLQRKEWEKAKEYAERAGKIYVTEEMKQILQECNTKLIEEYTALGRELTKEEGIELIWCFLQTGREKEGLEYHEKYHILTEDSAPCHRLRALLFLSNKRNREAIEEARLWRERLREEAEKKRQEVEESGKEDRNILKAPEAGKMDKREEEEPGEDEEDKNILKAPEAGKMDKREEKEPGEDEKDRNILKAPEVGKADKREEKESGEDEKDRNILKAPEAGKADKREEEESGEDEEIKRMTACSFELEGRAFGRLYAWAVSEKESQCCKEAEGEGSKKEQDHNILSFKEGALAAFEEALLLFPADIGFMMSKMLFLRELKQYEEMAALCEKIIEVDSRFFWGYYYAQEAHEELRNAREVIEFFYAARNIYPGLPEIYERAAKVYSAFKQFDQLGHILQLAREAGADSDFLKVKSLELQEENCKSQEDCSKADQHAEQLIKELEEKLSQNQENLKEDPGGENSKEENSSQEDGKEEENKKENSIEEDNKEKENKKENSSEEDNKEQENKKESSSEEDNKEKENKEENDSEEGSKEGSKEENGIDENSDKENISKEQREKIGKLLAEVYMERVYVHENVNARPMRNLEEMEKWLKRAVELNDSLWNRYYLGRFYSHWKEDNKAACYHLSQCEERGMEFGWMYFFLGRSLIDPDDLRQDERAVHYLKKAHEKLPDEADILWRIASIYRNKFEDYGQPEDGEKALEYLQAQVNCFGADYYDHWQYSRLYSRMRRMEEALKEIELCLETKSDSYFVNEKAYILENMERPREAMKYYEEAIRLKREETENEDYFFSYSRMYHIFAQEKWEKEGIRWFKENLKNLRTKKQYEENLNSLKQLYFQTGEWKKAEKTIKKRYGHVRLSEYCCDTWEGEGKRIEDLMELYAYSLPDEELEKKVKEAIRLLEDPKGDELKDDPAMKYAAWKQVAITYTDYLLDDEKGLYYLQRSLKHAAEIGENSHEYRCVLQYIVSCLWRLGRKEEAKKYASGFWKSLSMAYVRCGVTDKQVREMFERAIPKTRVNLYCVFFLAFFTGEYEEAKACYERMVNTHWCWNCVSRGCVEEYMCKGFLALHDHKEKEALEYFTLANEVDITYYSEALREIKRLKKKLPVPM